LNRNKKWVEFEDVPGTHRRLYVGGLVCGGEVPYSIGFIQKMPCFASNTEEDATGVKDDLSMSVATERGGPL